MSARSSGYFPRSFIDLLYTSISVDLIPLILPCISSAVSVLKLISSSKHSFCTVLLKYFLCIYICALQYAKVLIAFISGKYSILNFLWRSQDIFLITFGLFVQNFLPEEISKFAFVLQGLISYLCQLACLYYLLMFVGHTVSLRHTLDILVHLPSLDRSRLLCLFLDWRYTDEYLDCYSGHPNYQIYSWMVIIV